MSVDADLLAVCWEAYSSRVTLYSVLDVIQYNSSYKLQYECIHSGYIAIRKLDQQGKTVVPELQDKCQVEQGLQQWNVGTVWITIWFPISLLLCVSAEQGIEDLSIPFFPR